MAADTPRTSRFATFVAFRESSPTETDITTHNATTKPERARTVIKDHAACNKSGQAVAMDLRQINAFIAKITRQQF